MKSGARSFSLLRTLIWMTMFLMAAQIAYFLLGVLTAGLLHVIAAKSITMQVMTAPIVLLPFIVYISTQILLYAAFTWLIWYAARAAGKLFSLHPASTYSLGIMLWIICVITMFAANSLHYQQSIFALPMNDSLAAITLKACLWFGITCISVALLIIATHLMTTLRHKSLLKNDIAAIIFLSTITAFCINIHPFKKQERVASQASVERPNIILVSVEALRPDYIFTENTMPFLAETLTSSTIFTDAYTPIAQSFPSWMSLLTGKTPLHHGARSFYANYEKLDLRDSLITTLNAHGYESVYAVDGQRFGDMTTKLGFHHIISPPCGASELLIGSMSDFPLSNLTLNTPLGKLLFPYSYANRSIAATYHPDDFTDLIASELRTRSGKPLFLSVHFGISHWPYHWADDHMPEHQTLVEKYRYSLRAADHQIKQFFDFLRDEKLLEHALIIFISDHGTGLGLPGDSITNEKKYIGNKNALSFLQRLPYSHNSHHGIDTSYGYSTNILSMQQYRVLLAIKAIGFPMNAPHVISTRASLLDIAPTIFELLNIHSNFHADGISLVDAIKHRGTYQPRELFLENGFTAPEISQAKMDAADILKSSIQSVLLDPASGLFYVTESAQQSMLKNKQRAVLAGDWLLARFSPTVMVLANIKSGLWTTDLHSSLAKRAPLQKLLRDFERYNGGEIVNIVMSQ